MRGENAYHVFMPKIFRVILAIFVTHLVEDALNLMFLFILRIRISSNVITSFSVIFELVEIIDVIYIVRNFDTATGDTQAIIRDARLFLFL